MMGSMKRTKEKDPVTDKVFYRDLILKKLTTEFPLTNVPFLQYGK